MLGFRYLKAPSTTFVLQSQNGKILRKGAGLSFFYFAPTSVISLIPISSVDVPFAFNEVSADFQDIIVQGVLTYRIQDVEKLSSLLDFSVDLRERYRSDDPTKLGERLVQAAQTGARTFIQSRNLRQLLIGAVELVNSVSEALRSTGTIEELGVEILDVSIASIRPDPEMAKALQAQAREQLLREADQAIYERRNASVELERTIRENELKTEIAVAQKQREVRETQMQGEIAVEQRRADLVSSRVENERKESEARAEALRAILEPVKGVDWRILLAMQGNARSDTLISSAFEQLAQNAEKIGQLNITPDLLQSLTESKDK